MGIRANNQCHNIIFIMNKHYRNLEKAYLFNEKRIINSILYISSINDEYIVIKKSLRHILQSLLYINVSCKRYLYNGKNSFFQYTYFYREIIEHLTVLEQNKQIEKDKEIKELRNCLTHGIDPFYDGELNYILEKVNINYTVDLVEDIIKKFNREKLIYSEYTISYGSLKIDKINVRGYNLNINNALKIRNILEEISMYKDELRDIKLKNIYDLGLKYMEVINAIPYALGIKTFDIKIENEIFGSKEYYVRSLIEKIYQIYDKLGIYIDYKFNLGLPQKKKYFKESVKQLSRKNFHDNIDKKWNELRNSLEYTNLDEVRQYIIHEKINKISNITENIDEKLVRNINKLDMIVYQVMYEFYQKI